MNKPSLLIRRLTLSIFLPLVLLLAQQGALLHELGHWHAATPATAAAAGGHVPSVDLDSEFCLRCLAYAQVGGLASIEAPVAPAIDDLRYHFAPAPLRHVATATPPPARSRGPPLTA